MATKTKTARRVAKAPPATVPGPAKDFASDDHCWSCGDKFKDSGPYAESPAKAGICSDCYTNGIGEE